MIFLDVGPWFARMRWYCNNVRGVCSDNGTEKQIADMPNMLVDMYAHLDKGFKPDAHPRQE